jgi:DUF438 domain-containing protein
VDQIEMFSAILDSLTEEIVFTDTNHIIRYMNPAGKKHYESRGAAVGKDLFACHNEQSKALINRLLAQLQSGAEEVIFTDNEKHRVYMRAVRDGSGNLIGYYERYSSPR